MPKPHGDLAMFHLGPIYTNGPRGPIPDLRYVALNLEDKTAARIAKQAKAIAMAEHEGRKEGMEKGRASLLKEIRSLGTGRVNILSVMYMISHPDVRALATGAGSVWAVASRHVNECARTVLAERPTFEIMKENALDIP